MPSHQATSFTALLATSTFLAAQVPGNWPTHYPQWWYDADPAKSMIDISSLDDPGNQSPILQGQLLHMASVGIQELNEQLHSIGGAGFRIDDFKDPDKTPSYRSPAAIGQLKFVASKFYLRFQEIGYQPGSTGWNPSIVLNEGPADNSPLYPWKDDQTPDNLSIALIGQAKHTFAWNIQPWLQDVLSVDSDGDGLPDFWENYWGDLSFDQWTDSDGDGIVDLVEYAGGTDPLSANDILQSQYGSQSDADLVIVVNGRGVYEVHENATSTTLQ